MHRAQHSSGGGPLRLAAARPAGDAGRGRRCSLARRRAIATLAPRLRARVLIPLLLLVLVLVAAGAAGWLGPLLVHRYDRLQRIKIAGRRAELHSPAF